MYRKSDMNEWNNRTEMKNFCGRKSRMSEIKKEKKFKIDHQTLEFDFTFSIKIKMDPHIKNMFINKLMTPS